MMTRWRVAMHMESYIADPYWPELDDVISLQKKSGMNFQRSEAKRDAALLAYLQQQDLTMDDYRALVAKSSRRWYRMDDEDQASEIVIPRHQVSGALVQATKVSPSSVIKSAMADNLRSVLRIDPLATGKFKADALFRRYVKGESNQRRLHENEVIADFTASGALAFDPDVLRPATVRALFTYALVHVGVGACRKMGYGRGTLETLESE